MSSLQEIISPKFTNQVLIDIATKISKLSEVKVDISGIEETSSKTGDAYLSQSCRFGIDIKGINESGEEKTIFAPIFVKYLPKNLARRKTYRSPVFFENEAIFYDKVWPALDEFQNSKQIQGKFDNIPLVLSSWIDGSNDYIAMLDLSYQSYRNIARGYGLDYDHTVAILKLLAEFHGLSLAFKDQQPQLFEKAACSLKETFFAEEFRSWYVPFQQRLFVVARDAVEKELPPLYLDRLNKFISGDLFGEMCKACQNRGPLAVVTNGDVWTPNFLVKYEGTKIERIVLIDYQLSRYSTLVNELLFFLCSCVDIDIIEKQWDHLVAWYHQVLSETLVKYGSSSTLVTLEELVKQIKNGKHYGVGASIECLIMILLDGEEVADLDAIEGEDAVPVETVWKVFPIKQKEKRQRFARMIKHAVDRNFI